MEYGRTKVLACIDNTKDACLYFDNVIPLNLGHIIPWEGNGDLEAHEILQNVLPPALLNNSHPWGLTPVVISYIEAFVNAYPVSIGVKPGTEEEMTNRARHFFPTIIQRQNEMFASLKDPVDTIFGTESDRNNHISDKADPSLILSGLNLIDTSKIKWEHILEIKRDKESISKLRRLRTFIYQNYKGKSNAFIQDDLLNRIEVYETTTKQLGLETKDSALKVVFSSGSLIATAATAVMTAIAGSSVAIPLSLGIGSAFMLGNIGLELRSHKRNLYKFKQENPVTYLIDIKQLQLQ